MQKLTFRMFALAGVLTLTACGGSSIPTAADPAYPSVAGTWSGTMQTGNSGTVNVTFVVAQAGNLVSGTWTSDAAWKGTLNGGIDGTGSFAGGLTIATTTADGSPCTGSGTFGGAFTSSLFSAGSNGFTGACAALPTDITLLTRKQ